MSKTRRWIKICSTDGKRQKRVKLTGNWQCPMEPFPASQLQRSIWVGKNLFGETCPQRTPRELTECKTSCPPCKIKHQFTREWKVRVNLMKLVRNMLYLYFNPRWVIFCIKKLQNIGYIWRLVTWNSVFLTVINATIAQKALESGFGFPKISKSEVHIISESIAAALKLDICLVDQASLPTEFSISRGPRGWSAPDRSSVKAFSQRSFCLGSDRNIKHQMCLHKSSVLSITIMKPESHFL